MENVFVGFVYDSEKEEVLLSTSKAGVSTASNQYQMGFLSGLPEQMKILTTVSTGTFPRGNSRLWFGRESKSTPFGRIIYLPFVNFYFIREYMFRKGLYRELSRVIEKQEHTTVYVYSLFMPSLEAMDKLKKKYGDRFHYCLIIPDLPGKYGLVRQGIKGIKDRLDARKKMTLPNHADSFVFLTDAMKDLFAPKPYTVIEGFLPDCNFNYKQKRIPKTILYTGSLNRAFGIGTLLEAFSMIQDEDAQLWICGAGDMEDAVRMVAKKDKRIQFKGFLPKHEITALQTQCDVLINPRPAEGEYTKYSFPSKTMEYLLSGSKVVMCRLPGIGEEYYRYIRVIDANDAGSVAKVIVRACEDTEFYKDSWQEQVQWIKKNKNAKKRIETLISVIGQTTN